MNIYNRHDHIKTFDVFVSISQLPDGFGSADLIKLRVMSMVNDPHLVGECVMNADLCYRRKQMNGFIKLYCI